MIICLDTEFTRLPDGELISIGLVPLNVEHGAFYAENANLNESHCSMWVKKNVLTLLDGGNSSMNYMDIKNRLVEYLESFECKNFTFVADYSHDFYLLKQLFSDIEIDFEYRCDYIEEAIHGVVIDHGYHSLSLRNKTVEKYCDYLTDYFKNNPQSIQHHALTDSIAMRHALIECFEWLKQK